MYVKRADLLKTGNLPLLQFVNIVRVESMLWFKHKGFAQKVKHCPAPRAAFAPAAESARGCSDITPGFSAYRPRIGRIRSAARRAPARCRAVPDLFVRSQSRRSWPSSCSAVRCRSCPTAAHSSSANRFCRPGPATDAAAQGQTVPRF